MNLREKIPAPKNEPILEYRKNSKEKAEVKKELKNLYSKELEIPLYIGGREIITGNVSDCLCPHEHGHILGRYHTAGSKEIKDAVNSALKAKKDWAEMSFKDRASIFLKAAELLSTSWRQKLNAATMLGQSKNIFQSEIDAACEMIDFWNFNAYYAQQVYDEQPLSVKGIWNCVEQRPLEGFVFAVSPFNFTSIAGNLCTAPALMGNTVVWKPAKTAVYSAYFIMELLKEAGLPDGVINMVTGSSSDIGNYMLNHENLAGVHFTGSTAVFQNMWETTGKNIKKYKSYPRLVGETGGKDFIFVHSSAGLEETASAIIRGAFEYQGQKCSAVSRVFVPRSLWPKLKAMLLSQISEIKMGDVCDFTNFVNAVIDKDSFDKIKSYIDYVKKSGKAKIIYGGKCDDSKGYFIEPTVIETEDPYFKTMIEEIFGPVVTICPYEDKKMDDMLIACDKASPYALTGAVFARDRQAIVKITKALTNTAGNFYINDKPTGAVVGQQPFGGSRASGTNDKAGSKLNLLRWISPRTIKENFAPAIDYKYPFMETE
jgi:1-pyrroline-5-carboxylate dehydrogenase